MAKQDGFSAVFAGLKQVLAPHAPALVVTADGPGHYALDTLPSEAQPKGLFFGGVQVKKNYVSFHLMPVYEFPDLLDGVAEPLRRRMQGKSCFNFSRLDEAARSGLADLTAAGFHRYERERVVEGTSAFPD